jgi:cyclophilin family peptidyl-prolyl cis-trans isomerase
MKKYRLAALPLAVMIALNAAPISATSPVPAPVIKAPEMPSPSEIVAAAPAEDWTTIAASDLLWMELPPGTKGKPRRVVIQLMPAPFSQGWVGNIRKLAAAKFWDGLAIVRVQDNYVTQWGDPDGEDAAKAKKLPDGLNVMTEADYEVYIREMDDPTSIHLKQIADVIVQSRYDQDGKKQRTLHYSGRDPYARMTGHIAGWPIAADSGSILWPVHCYGMVGVGRNLSPDTGTGAELYTVIGHAPRHLDGNIALVGRIIEGMEHMSSLPRGTGALGFYETPEERTKILSATLMSELGNDKSLPTYEYLNTDSESFAKYTDARANRRDPFFIKPAGGADICNIPVPVRRVKR